MEYTYIHETDTIFEANGELHLISGEKTIVFNCEGLFNDLPYIIDMVLKARSENTKLIKKQIIKTINNKKSL
jgi:hypothetical protein